MSWLTLIYIGLIAVFAVLVFRRTDTVLPVAFLGIMYLAAYLALTELLGRPKPIEFDQLGEETTLLSFKFDKDVVYVWVVVPDESTPMSYIVPRPDDEEARKQQAGMFAEAAAALKDGRLVKFSRRFSDGEYLPQPMPHQEPPPKNVQPGGSNQWRHD